MYWALTTMTTVGYGDIEIHKTGGKLIASVKDPDGNVIGLLQPA